MSKMKTEYKYIYFEDKSSLYPKRKTAVWCCFNKSSHLMIATIAWNGRWRQYCFFPEKDTVFSSGCMDDIIDFINQLKQLRNNKD